MAHQLAATARVRSIAWLFLARMCTPLSALQEDGFTPAVVARLASQLEVALPSVFGNHTLSMAWGYKYDSGGAGAAGAAGIGAHADQVC